MRENNCTRTKNVQNTLRDCKMQCLAFYQSCQGELDGLGFFFEIYLFIEVYLLVEWGRVGTHAMESLQSSEVNFVVYSLLLPLCGYWGSNSGPQAYVVSSFTHATISKYHSVPWMIFLIYTSGYIFCLYGGFTCMHVCVPHASLRALRGQKIVLGPLELKYRQL